MLKFNFSLLICKWMLFIKYRISLFQFSASYSPWSQKFSWIAKPCFRAYFNSTEYRPNHFPMYPSRMNGENMNIWDRLTETHYKKNSRWSVNFTMDKIFCYELKSILILPQEKPRRIYTYSIKIICYRFIYYFVIRKSNEGILAHFW